MSTWQIRQVRLEQADPKHLMRSGAAVCDEASDPEPRRNGSSSRTFLTTMVSRPPPAAAATRPPTLI